jgi:pimeloyl-ACP methyl ester carboxylesterase
MPFRLMYPALLGSALLAATGPSSLAQTSPGAGDPVTSDPRQVDTTYPPRTAELAFQSKASRLNGFFYLANGKGPHATVILLHGFPGNERNLDLAQALRRVGMNVLFFSYRGAWGSGGTFSFSHAIEDVGSAVHFVRTDSSVAAFRIDPGRVILVGHSMGGWLALMSAAADSSISCTVALDFWNVGADGRRIPSDRQLDSTLTTYSSWLTAPGGPLHADSALSLVAEMKAHADLWDLDRSARALSSRRILLLSTTANESHATLMAALRAAHAKHVAGMQWNTDHGFSDRRIRLGRTIAGWLKQQCST